MVVCLKTWKKLWCYVWVKRITGECLGFLLKNPTHHNPETRSRLFGELLLTVKQKKENECKSNNSTLIKS